MNAAAANRQGWRKLCEAAGLYGAIGPWFDRLRAAYHEPQRHYHDLRHIAECLAEFSLVREQTVGAAGIELALWFHDVVYDPRSSANEVRSADLAEQCLHELGGPAELADAVRLLVLATQKHDASLHPSAGVMVDVDLSIFGKPTERFREYEAQIRREYDWVPTEVFNPKRAEILEGFLQRERIFNTETFSRRYEATARENLEGSIEKLRGKRF